MIEIIQGLPSNVVGLRAKGKVHATDYREVLKPAIDEVLKTGAKLRLLYVLGDEFEGYTGGALWEDTKTAVADWKSCDKVAVVTDTRWVIDGIKLVG